VVGRSKWDCGPFSVADQRLPSAHDRGPWLILSVQGAWHRPFTTWELAALQGFPLYLADGRPLALDGDSDTGWRTRIGNAVPPPAAEAIGSVMLETLLRQQLRVSFILSAAPIWVQPLATALSVAGGLHG
jgi:hypothetical protein